MTVLIVEDEQEAIHRLRMFLTRYETEEQDTISVVKELDSIKDTIEWFRNNASPDLVLMDIHLADGLSFEIFRHIEINTPIIFTTAYDEYALHAFNVHSIAYLLKPFGYADIRAALRKLALQKEFFQTAVPTPNSALLQDFQTALQEVRLATQQQQKHFRTRFLLNIGESIVIVPTKDIQYFFAEGKIVSIVLDNGRKYIAEETLEEIEYLLNPAEFFRISRKFLLRAESITSVEPYFNGRLLLKLLPAFSDEVLVSRERVKDFKHWLERASM